MSQVYRDAFNETLQACVKGGCKLRWERPSIGMLGCFGYDKGKPVIFIDPNLSLDQTYETFVHELVHARQYRKFYNQDGINRGLKKIKDKTYIPPAGSDGVEINASDTASEIMLRVRDHCELSQHLDHRSMYQRLDVLGELYGR